MPILFTTINAPGAADTDLSFPQRGTDQAPFTIKILSPDDAEKKTEKEERERAEKADIDKKLASETERIADYTWGLVAATLLLFFAAVAQIFLFWTQLQYLRGEAENTKTLAEQAKQSTQHMRLIERAYVTGGFGERDTSNRLCASVHNNGKTPAIIDYMFIDMRPLGKPPPLSEIFTKRKYVNYSVPPQSRIIARDHWVERSGAGDQIFFGRFWYTDIFGDKHESGFALLVKADSMSAYDAPEYWGWT
jgi:hypothetical protein